MSYIQRDTLSLHSAILWCPLFIVLALSPLPANSAEEFKIKHFSDWSLRCQLATDSTSRNCELFQRVVHKKSEQQLLQLAFAYQQGSKQPVAIALLPLGILLTSGIGLQVDNNKAIQSSVRTCTAQGCQMLFLAGDEFLRSLKAGLILRVAFLDATSGRQITVPISLKGFSAGIKALRATR